MKKELRSGRHREGRFESASVIRMAVAENDGVGCRKMNPEAQGIVKKCDSLAGVEEHLVRARIQPIGKPVFSKNAGASGRIFDQNRE